jgi:hypothetical protein
MAIVQVIPPNGNDYEVELQDNQLRHLQELVDGYIEIIYIGAGEIAVVNEEGALPPRLEPNHPATRMTGLPTVLHGTVVIMHQTDLD